MKKGFLFSTFLILTVAVSAQFPIRTPANPKMDEFILLLESTKFIQNYKAYQEATETKVQALKLATDLDAKTVNKLKIAYKQSQFKFDAIWNQLKEDIVTHEGRKRIKKNPAAVSKIYNNLLEEAQDYCNNCFHQNADKLLYVNEEDVCGGYMILIIDSFMNSIKNYIEKKDNDKIINALYLEEKFMEPLRFKSWNKIESLN